MYSHTGKNPGVQIPRPKPLAKLRLFCLPHAGGTSTAFREWADDLPGAIELCIVEIPGHGYRLNEALMHRLQPLVMQVAQDIEPYLDKPFVIFGHSMGNLLGFELSHYLQNAYQKTPVHLFLSGRGAPHLPPREEPIHQLPEDQFIQKITEYNGTPKEVLQHKELMDLMLPILRCDFEVCETYRFSPKPPFSFPMTIFGGLSDPGSTKSDLQEWKRYTTASFSLRMFPGDHFFIFSAQKQLLQAIVRDINDHFPISTG